MSYEAGSYQIFEYYMKSAGGSIYSIKLLTKPDAKKENSVYILRNPTFLETCSCIYLTLQGTFTLSKYEQKI